MTNILTFTVATAREALGAYFGPLRKLQLIIQRFRRRPRSTDPTTAPPKPNDLPAELDNDTQAAQLTQTSLVTANKPVHVTNGPSKYIDEFFLPLEPRTPFATIIASPGLNTSSLTPQQQASLSLLFITLTYVGSQIEPDSFGVRIIELPHRIRLDDGMLDPVAVYYKLIGNEIVILDIELPLTNLTVIRSGTVAKPELTDADVSDRRA